MSIVFEFPKIHSFPPLYTKQPNLTILQNQLESWGEIILSYCQHYKITSLSLLGSILHTQLSDVDDNEIPPLFENKNINRAVNDDFKAMIFKHLIHKLHRAEYINPKQPETGILIYWKTLIEWANILHDFVERTGQLGSVLTIYELTKLEDSGVDEDLKDLDYNLLVRILKGVLIKQGRAQILMNEDGTQIGGVKIV